MESLGLFGFKTGTPKVQVKIGGRGGCASSIGPKKFELKPKKPLSGIYHKQKQIPSTDFMFFYDRGDMPLLVDYEKGSRIVRALPD